MLVYIIVYSKFINKNKNIQKTKKIKKNKNIFFLFLIIYSF